MAQIHDYMKVLMKRDFPGYKRVQVAATLGEIEVIRRKAKSEKRLFGFTIHKEYGCEARSIPLKEFAVVYESLYLGKLNKKTNVRSCRRTK